MPENGIAKIVSGPLPHPSTANGTPRCELYLVGTDLVAACERAKQAGARLIDGAKDRDWDIAQHISWIRMDMSSRWHVDHR
ncbi:MAG: hypothetical protein IPF95_18025 [Flavobacteriales bacterium]|nr:hypothetical protein [Flavobacteriales bacterium]